MACGVIDPANTFLWLSLGGILLGGGLAFLLAPSHLGHFEGRYAFGSDQLLCLLQVVCLDLPGKAFSL